MSSAVDTRIALAAMTSILTAFTSAVVVSTGTFATSVAQQITNENGVATGLTSAEIQVINTVIAAVGSATPSATIHSSNLNFAIDTRTLHGAMTSILTALSSATGVTTGNFATQLSSMNAIDTGLTNQEKGLVTLFSASIGTSAPAANAHTQV